MWRALKVSKIRIHAFMNLWDRDKGKAEFLRMYCHDEDNGKYIGLDNSTGNCLVREFDRYTDLKEWFLSKF